MYFHAFYPVGLNLPLRRRPWLSFLLLGSMAVTFLWWRYAPHALAIRPVDLVFWPGNRAPATVLTAVFLHGDWLHLIGNLVYLWVFAPPLEDRLGPGRFLLVFLMLGAAGNLAHGALAVSGWFGAQATGVLGASGAISGLLGIALTRLAFARVVVAYWIFAPLQGQNRAGRRELALPVAVLAWLLLQITNAAVAPITGTGVSYGAHFGGFLLGLVLGWGLGLGREGRAESSLVRARQHLERGEAFAAMGAYGEYLAVTPGDLAAQREYARAEVMAGQDRSAVARLKGVYEIQRQRGDVDAALDVYLEGRRLLPGLGLTAGEIVELARHLETKADRQGALQAYQDLLAVGPQHRSAPRAWVRIVMLLHDDPRRSEETQQWLQRAWAALPPGAWRDFLADAFNLAADRRGELAAGPAGCSAAPGS